MFDEAGRKDGGRGDDVKAVGCGIVEVVENRETGHKKKKQIENRRKKKNRWKEEERFENKKK